MQARLKNLLLAASALWILGCGFMPAVVSAARTTPDTGGNTSAAATCRHTFLGLEPWYQYLKPSQFNGNCTVKCFNVFTQSEKNLCGRKASDVPLVLLAVVDDLLRIAGLVAIGYLIYAGFNFITSQGNPEDAAKARTTAINALVGLAVAMVAVVLVSFVGKSLGG